MMNDHRRRISRLSQTGSQFEEPEAVLWRGRGERHSRPERVPRSVQQHTCAGFTTGEMLDQMPQSKGMQL